MQRAARQPPPFTLQPVGTGVRDEAARKQAHSRPKLAETGGGDPMAADGLQRTEEATVARWHDAHGPGRRELCAHARWVE